MIEIRRAETDAELEAWRAVRMALLPNERCDSVADLRQVGDPDRLYVLAFLDGRLAASGVAGRSDTQRGFAVPRVLAEARRRGAQWEREWAPWPDGTFVALAGDEIVGCAGLLRDQDRPDRAENSLTAVRRDWRGRGLARALKETVTAFGAANGLREIYTWTQTGNENMRAVNEKLGYVTRDVTISVRALLPLPL